MSPMSDSANVKVCVERAGSNSPFASTSFSTRAENVLGRRRDRHGPRRRFHSLAASARTAGPQSAARSRLSAVLTAGWLMPSRRAAALTLPAS